MNVHSIRALLMALVCLLSFTARAAAEPGLFLSRTDVATTIAPPQFPASRMTIEPTQASRELVSGRRVATVAIVVTAAAGLAAALLYFVVFPRTAKAAGNAAANRDPSSSGPLLDR